MGTHNLCFGAKIRKNRYTPANSSFLYTKVEFKGVYFSWTCIPDKQFEVPILQGLVKNNTLSHFSLECCRIGDTGLDSKSKFVNIHKKLFFYSV